MGNRLGIVLAAGKGTRMKSDLPKVLFPVAGRPMIEYVLDALRAAEIERIVVVVGYRADLVRETLSPCDDIEYVLQEEQLGTGHAVKMCHAALAAHDGPALIVTGDSPLTQTESLLALLNDFETDQPACVLGTLHKPDPTGLGRILRDADGRFTGIIEEKDATDQQKQITEVNMSTYVFAPKALLESLEKLQNDNRQGEYYVTDCPGILIAEGRRVRALPALKPIEALSINTVDDLAIVEAELLKQGN